MLTGAVYLFITYFEQQMYLYGSNPKQYKDRYGGKIHFYSRQRTPPFLRCFMRLFPACIDSIQVHTVQCCSAREHTGPHSTVLFSAREHTGPHSARRSAS